MKPANLTLVMAGCISSAFVGGFIGGVTSILMGAVVGGITSLIGCLGTSYVIGLWIGKREQSLSEREILIGCWSYVLLSVVLVGISRHPAGVVFALIGGAGVAYFINRGALKSLRSLFGAAVEPARSFG